MKPAFHRLPVPPNTSFVYQKMEFDHFPNPWHFHREYELVVVNKSCGTRFIGDHVSKFEAGDCCLIGSNIPHLYRNNDSYYPGNSALKAQSTIIHFSRNFPGPDFFDLPEMKKVNALLDLSSRALNISGRTKDRVIERLQDMEHENAAQRLISLLHILVLLSNSNELLPLLTTGISGNPAPVGEKIDLAVKFITEHYEEPIYMQDIAAKLNMSVAAFSRYFKCHTRKTFSDFVIEVRIRHACRLLLEDKLNISEIGYQCGFSNMSNFYRQFKKVTGTIPKDFKNRYAWA